MNKKITTNTIGCKVNYADTQAVAAMLPDSATLPLEIVATCCVTAAGEKQSRKEIRRASRRAGSEGVVIVTGCAARLKPHELEELGANVRVVTGEPQEVAGAINAMTGLEVDDGIKEEYRYSRTRYFLKVQDGCANMCSYCVVPLVRGRPSSIANDLLIEQAREQVGRGCPELVVSGINLGAYDDGNMKLPGLIRELAAIEGLVRLRLSSIEVMHLTAELIDLIDENSLIARHLHVPLQSGDDAVLADMKRRYDRRVFTERLAEVHEKIEDINLTTDVIVGFPTEDDPAFRSTLDYINATGFTRVHVFTYSNRPGTAAESMGDRVSIKDKKSRSREARSLSQKLQQRHRERKLGKVSEVLLESGAPDGMLSGYSEDYTRFIVSGGHPGDLAMVYGESILDEGVQGKVVDRG